LAFAHSFAELSRNFRENTTICRPQPSAGGASEEKQTPGALVSGSGKEGLTFGSLAAAFGAWFFRLQKATLGSTSGRRKDVLQDHGIWLWRSLTFGSLACAVLFSCQTPGGQEVVALHKL